MAFNKISFSTDYKKSAYDVLGTYIPNDSRHTVLHFLWKYRHICHRRLRMGSGTPLLLSISLKQSHPVHFLQISLTP